MPTLNSKGTRENKDKTFYQMEDAAGPSDGLKNLLRYLEAYGKINLALDQTTRVDFAILIQEALPYAHRQFSDSTIGALRMRKNGDDYECLKRHA